MIVRATMIYLLCLGIMGMPGLMQAQQPGETSGTAKLLAGRVLLPDGTLRNGAVVVVQGGKIERIGQESEFENQTLHRLGPEVVISPGMIDLFAMPGAVGQTVEDTDAIEPETNAARVLDPSHGDFRNALEAGVTSVLVGPAATNLVNGVCVTTRTYVPGHFDILRRDGPLLLAFGEGVWRSDRKPTSRSGATQELRNVIEQARNGEAHQRVNAAVAGELDAWIACSDKVDVLAVRQALGDARGRFGVIHTKDALDAVDAVQGMRQPVVMGPYSMTASRRELLGAAALANAGIEVAFRAGCPTASPHALRLSAALAVRHGMDPSTARRAITIAPAEVAGVADRVGSIAVGKDADLVLFSRDPLRMDARVLEVYVLGQRVYSAQHQNTSLAGGKP